MSLCSLWVVSELNQVKVHPVGICRRIAWYVCGGGTHCSSQVSCVIQNVGRNSSKTVVPSTGVPSGFTKTILKLTDRGHLESSGIRDHPDQSGLDQRFRNPSQPAGWEKSKDINSAFGALSDNRCLL